MFCAYLWVESKSIWFTIHWVSVWFKRYFIKIQSFFKIRVDLIWLIQSSHFGFVKYFFNVLKIRKRRQTASDCTNSYLSFILIVYALLNKRLDIVTVDLRGTFAQFIIHSSHNSSILHLALYVVTISTVISSSISLLSCHSLSLCFSFGWVDLSVSDQGVM